VSEPTETATASDIWVSVASSDLGGTGERTADLISVVVDQDLNQPDMCAITVKNTGHTHTNERKLGDAVEVKVGGSGGTTIFKGELVGIEPSYEAGGESKCVLRSFNRMHRLLRGRKSRTFKSQTDQKIAEVVAGDAGLSVEAGGSPSITHDHVYQHNQTNLEFLRVRAARIGFEVWVEDRTLYFDKPNHSADSGIELKLQRGSGGGAVTMEKFTPRLSSAGIVKEVKVRGWDPVKKEAIEGSAKSDSSPLGSTTAATASKPLGDNVVTFEVDHPIFSKDEATAIAKSRLNELSLEYLVGEAECRGSASIKPGIVVKITVNPDKADDRFNGKYLVVGATHVYTFSGGAQGGQGGYRTIVRVRRDAEKGS